MKINERTKASDSTSGMPLTKMNIPDIDIIDLNKDSGEQAGGHQTAQDPLSSDLYDTEAQSEDFIEESSDHKGKKSHLWHIAIVAAIIVSVFLIGWRILNYGILVNPNDYADGEDLSEVMDNIVPLNIPEELKPEDDGVTTIVMLGNDPFADDRDSKEGLANIIAEMADAVVYNCSISGSYLAATGISIEEDPFDALNLYWLTLSFCLPDLVSLSDLYQTTFDQYADVFPADGRESYNLLKSIDFNKVDVIAIMYDASDYLAQHPIFNPGNTADVGSFAGNLEASIEMIQQTYPHIRIIVLSPTFAYTFDENGGYISSETTRYGDMPLSDYVIMELDSAYSHAVTFVDNLYGTINEDNASDYLVDHIHLNTDGRREVAKRFIYALNYFNSTTE